jgi:elongation factor P
MANTSDIKNGMCIDLDGHYYFIVEFLHVKPGKGAAFVRTKLKSVTTGRTIDKTFNAGVKIDEVRIERRPYQYLYQDDMGYNFMNQETFEQIPIAKDLITGVDFLKEGDIVDVVSHAESETVLYAEVPVKVTLKVTYTEPGLKGDTATNATKPATLETGATVRVPLFVNEGELIEIDTRDGSYQGRVKG